MNFTNIHSLPKVVTTALDYAKGLYSAGISDYTPSSLNTPPQIRRLMKEHHKELEGDYSEVLASFLGTSVHDMFERSLENNPDYITEERYYRYIDMPDGSKRLVSGQVDAYEIPSNSLIDFKITSIYKGSKGADRDWTLQGNINAFIMRKPMVYDKALKELVSVNPLPVENLYNVIWCKDWRQSEVNKKAEYPETPIMIIPLPFMDEADVIAYIVNSVEQHEAETVRECTPEERWADLPKFAVTKEGNTVATSLVASEAEAEMVKAELEATVELPQYTVAPKEVKGVLTYGVIKEGGKRPSASFNTPEEAEAYISEQQEKARVRYNIVERKGNLWRRCEKWCSVKQWCPQYQKGQVQDLLKEFE